MTHRRLSAATALAVAILAVVAIGAPATASPSRAAAPRIDAIPVTPTFAATLDLGVNTSTRLTLDQRIHMVEDVAWLQGRIDYILPRIHVRTLIPIDGVYDQTTAAAIKTLKTWANKAHAALHLPPLFAHVDTSVDARTEAIIALVAAYFQRHPAAGVVTKPQSDDQTVLMILLNEDRVRAGVPLAVVDPQVQGAAEKWTAYLNTQSAPFVQNQTLEGTQIKRCYKQLAQSVATDFSLRLAYTSLHDEPNSDGSLNAVNPAFTVVGTGVVIAPHGEALVVIDFIEPCPGNAG